MDNINIIRQPGKLSSSSARYILVSYINRLSTGEYVSSLHRLELKCLFDELYPENNVDILNPEFYR